MPLIRYIQKITRDQNFLVWRDTIYINADNRPQYLSLKLISDIDALLQGKISEYVFQSEFKEVKFSCDEIRVLGKSLVLELLFYEGTGTTIHDTSGNKSNGTAYGGPTWGQLLNGKYYLHSDGIDDYIVVPHNDKLNVAPGNKITIEALAYLEGWKEGYLVGVLIDKRTENVANYNWEYSTGTMFMRIHAQGAKWIISFPHSLNKWNHYVMVLDGSWLGGYLNGELKAYRNDVPATQGNTRDLLIFKCVYNTCYSKAKLALVRIWQASLKTKVSDLFKLAQIMVPDLA